MKSPFKFLDSYTKEDREIYFGREREINELYHRLFESRIMLVYGESGTGKSSLVNCGLINKLRDTDHLPVYVRRSDNILESLSDAIHGLLKESLPYQLLTALLFKKALRALSIESGKHIFFIFDQFEELFIFGTKEEIQSLVQVVKALAESDIDCRFIFIIREEYFANIAEFEKHIPNFLSNRMRIERMDRTNAVTAIKGPCNVHDIQVEDGFAESLLKKLNPESPGVELTYLQIYLDKIFNLAINEGNAHGSGHKPLSFTIGLIEKTGDVSDLLGSFLDEQISFLGKPDTALAILKSFVSYKGTKRQLNLAEVKDYANTLGEHVKEKDVLEIIGSLVHLRILCDKNEDGFYELRHDALAAKIFEKISAAEIEILEVRQFIENAHYFWKKRGVLLSEDDLKYIEPFEKRLSLSEELTNLIGRSRETLNRAKIRKRNIIVSGGIIIILLLSVFSVWALKERNRAEGLNTKVLAEKYNLLATNITIHDPTKGLRLAEYAYSLDSTNQNILSNIKRIYSDNIFYTLIAKHEDAFAKQEDAIFAVTFSPDSKYILIGSGDGTAKLWDLDGYLIKIFIGHCGYVNSVAFSPDGQSILTGSSDRSARLWDLKGNVIKDFKGHSMSINSVAFSPDGKEILTGSSDRTARLWDLKGNVIQEFKGHKSSVSAVAFSPGGQQILTGSTDSTARLWNLKGKQLIVVSKHLDNVNTVAFSPDGQTIVTGSSDKTVKLWELNGTLIRVFSGFPGEVNDVVFSPDGKNILIGASAGYAVLWDLNGNEIKEFKGHTIQVRAVAFSPDGAKIITGSGDCTAKLWNLHENLNQVYIGHKGRITSVKFSKDGKEFLTGSSDKTARLWDINGNTIKLFKGHKNGINDAAFSPDGKTVLTGSDDDTAKLWDVHGNMIKVFSGHKSGVTSVTFSPDGQKVLTGSQDATARLWDINGNIDQVFSGYKSYVTSVAFSPDGQIILIGMDNGSIRLYPVKMSYNNYNKIDKYEKLSSFDKLQYNILDINNIRSSHKEKALLQASDYYINEAIQSGMSEKSKYLNYAIELYNKLLKENPGKKEYLFNLLRASVYSYEANPIEQTKEEIEKINDKILSFTSIDDLTLAGYTYCLICVKNDLTINQLRIPDCFLRICSKLLTDPDLPEAERKDISRWCSFVATDFIQKKEFIQALQAIQKAKQSDSTNIEIQALLPIAFIFNNQYDKAKTIINEFKNKPLTGIDYFKTYKEVYLYSIDLLEERAITHPDFAKVKELLKK